ncbi:Lipid-phosphate phosphatase [Actinidia chinensis var. chinensis]|uniref:Lipid-phosphate phosphatase n=1 Tax=Actinidia chinensis var. chinensis TaxID=1590841 RepID=A0A2R6PNW2_ACTCC|nr:Lipid-phosphate phosphatase [Actinidia chinensis var. chinensis]
MGHDWGASMALYFCLFRPDGVRALVNMSIVFYPRYPLRKPLQSLRSAFGDDYYMCRFQEPGEAEEEFAQVDTGRLQKYFLTSRICGPYCVSKEVGFGGSSHTPMPCPRGCQKMMSIIMPPNLTRKVSLVD